MAGGGETRRGKASGEKVLEAAFTARGLECRRYEATYRAPADRCVVLLEHPFTTLYGTDGRLDFVLLRNGVPSVALEVKHQGQSGSCDEKLPYVLLNGIYQWPAPHGILVLSGDHWTSPRGVAIQAAMRDMAARLTTTERHFEVFDVTQATNWIARAF